MVSVRAGLANLASCHLTDLTVADYAIVDLVTPRDDVIDWPVDQIDKSTNSSIERSARRGEPLLEVRAPLHWLARRGLFRIRSRSCIPARFGIERLAPPETRQHRSNPWTSWNYFTHSYFAHC